MQDHASHWTHLAPLGEPSRSAARRRRRSAIDWTSSPAVTGIVLTASTLCAAGTFLWMLPAAGRGTPAAQPPAVVATAPNVPAAVEDAAGPGSVALPRLLTSFALAAGETLARVEHQYDAGVMAMAAAPQPMATAAYAAAGAVAPTSDRVVYLVDASGSLVDSLPRVIEWLGESLDGLKRHQQFTVLFFRRGQVFEVPPTGLKSATFASKAAVWGWMQPETGNVMPQGRSDMAVALRAAMQYEPREIVLLSDDSLARRSGDDGDSILTHVAQGLQGQDVTIHTVQFFYRDQAGALEAIADRFGGRYDFIQPAQPDRSAKIDPLLAPLVN